MGKISNLTKKCAGIHLRKIGVKKQTNVMQKEKYRFYQDCRWMRYKRGGL